MTNFNLNLDLSAYFEDLRKHSCVYVDLSKCKKVGDVENHIRSIFDLEDNICLTSKKFLIPRCENVNILQQFETLKVQKCDFFDYHIHKTKRTNNACDQTALNLIQSERTIDLSCRPKQRFKINICQSQCIPGAQLTSFTDIGKVQHLSRPSPSGHTIRDETYHILAKEKHKKKKHTHDKLKSDCNGVGNVVDILDMSVNKSAIKYVDNCFATDANIEVNGKSPSKFSGDSGTFMEIQEESSTSESKKSKKRKRYLQLLENKGDVGELQLLQNERDVGEVRCSENDNDKCRKKKSKSKKHKTEDTTTHEASSNSTSYQHEEKESSLIFHDTIEKRKCKKKKTVDVCERLEDKQENVSSFNISTDKGCNLVNRKPETKSEETNLLGLSNSTPKRNLDEYKQSLREHIDKVLSQMKNVNPLIDILDSKDNQYANKQCFPQNKSTDISDTIENSHTNGAISQDREQSTRVGSLSEFLDANLKTKFKRVRKHNKKKKRERKEYLSAVGPVLSQMIVPSAKSSSGSPDCAKHIFFTDDDFIEEMEIPATPANRSQTASQGSPAKDENSKGTESQKGVGNLSTWQDELLKLASSASKPLVFHRSSPVKASNTDEETDKSFEDPSIPADHSYAEQTTRCSVSSENGRFVLVGNGVAVDLTDNKVEHEPLRGSEGCSVATRESKTDPTPDVTPILPDVQAIILAKYPIIDKVVADDLILFKVLKLNENNQPGCSKTILGKVNSSTVFPEKISLLIMEGCEECDSYKSSSAETVEGFVVELRWADMFEPRLFYP